MKFNEESFKKALSECKIVRWQNHFKNVVKAYLKAEKEQCIIADVVSSSNMRKALETVVRGYESDGMENMQVRDNVFYKTCKEALDFDDNVSS